MNYVSQDFKSIIIIYFNMKRYNLQRPASEKEPAGAVAARKPSASGIRVRRSTSRGTSFAATRVGSLAENTRCRAAQRSRLAAAATPLGQRPSPPREGEDSRALLRLLGSSKPRARAGSGLRNARPLLRHTHLENLYSVQGNGFRVVQQPRFGPQPNHQAADSQDETLVASPDDQVTDPSLLFVERIDQRTAGELTGAQEAEIRSMLKRLDEIDSQEGVPLTGFQEKSSRMAELEGLEQALSGPIGGNYRRGVWAGPVGFTED